MRTILIALSLMFAQPAFSKSGVTAFDEYLKSQGIPIHGINGCTKEAEINFKDEATKEQKDFANAARATFDWNDRTDPQPAQFLDKLTDQIISGKVDATAVGPIILLNHVANDPAKVKALWGKITTDSKLTAEAKTAIETAAQEAGMALK